ncbi:MAG TPA: AMP-binding protein [Streptosporangiaceae bacterium]|jgi:2-aminobenzoate-CoA ligase|nr:AMP-binding protein [Streptosporangiaceae bacterium]
MQLSPSAHADTFCRDSLPPADQWPDLEFTLPELRYPDRLNAADELLNPTIAAGGADRRCLLSPAETWTYGQVADRASQIARVLTEDLGLVPGNRVLLRSANNPWLAACWLGVLKAGGVAVTTMPMLRAAELSRICDIAQVRLALCDHRLTGELTAAAVPGLRVVTVGAPGPADLTAAAAAKPADFATVRTAADDVAMIAFTSGTTGRPKAAMHFHRDLIAAADTFSAQVLKPVPADVFAGTPPLAFTFGLGALLLFPLRAGASALLLEQAAPAELADYIAAHGVTVLSTAPTAYRAMLAAGKAEQLRGLRRPVSAGEHLSESTWTAFYQATGVKIIDGIGSTEMLHIFVGSADDDIRPGSTGREVPGYTAAVLDDDGKPAPDGQPGRLAVKGPTGCLYLSDDRQRSYVRNGWNLTGDTYVRDADGYFWYQARSDDMIISGGYNIAGPEIEEVLLSHPDVTECGVVGVPDEARGQIVKAFVILRDGASADETKARELQDLVKRQIAPYKYPRAVEFVTSLPRTNTGKLQRFRLREQAAGEQTEQTGGN